MPLSTTAVVRRVRELLASVDGVRAAYGPTEQAREGIPEALSDFPCAVVWLGATKEYGSANGGGGSNGGGYSGAHEHVYDVSVWIICAAAGASERAAQGMPILDAVLTKMASNITLSGLVRWCLFQSQSGYGTLTYAGQEYLGYEMTFEVSEAAEVVVEGGE